ncbi:MAG: autoinducer binding domain-containing protein, partial [Gammaproteobacteria bacterium]
MDAKTLDRIEAFSGCDSLDTLYAATKSIVADMGFDYFIYGVRVATSLTNPYQFVFSGYPPEWRRHYVQA